MFTATIGIGNSDNKLTQLEWSNFIQDMSTLLSVSAYEIYFAGFSDPKAPWQNACWVINIGDDSLYLKKRLRNLCDRYRQTSIALTLGQTELVTPKESNDTAKPS